MDEQIVAEVRALAATGASFLSVVDRICALNDCPRSRGVVVIYVGAAFGVKVPELLRYVFHSELFEDPYTTSLEQTEEWFAALGQKRTDEKTELAKNRNDEKRDLVSDLEEEGSG